MEQRGRGTRYFPVLMEPSSVHYVLNAKVERAKLLKRPRSSCSLTRIRFAMAVTSREAFKCWKQTDGTAT
jgi:hypothetical protein